MRSSTGRFLARIRAFDAELKRVRSAKPYPESGEPDDGMHLLEVELHARGLQRFKDGELSFKARIEAFEQRQREAFDRLARGAAE